MATNSQKLAALKRLTASRSTEARDALGRWTTSTAGQQAGSAVRKEVYKAGLRSALAASGTTVPHAELAASLLANVTEATVKKVVAAKQSTVLDQAGEVLGESTHTPEQQGMAKAINAAVSKLPDLAAKIGTTQAIGHGLQAVMVHGLHLDPAASAMVSHVAAAAIEPHARKMAGDLYAKLKRQAKVKYATT